MDGHSGAQDQGQQIGDGHHEACGGQQAERPACRPVEARPVGVARKHHRLEIAAEQQCIDGEGEDRGADTGGEQDDIERQREEVSPDEAAERGERERDILSPADIDRTACGGGIVAPLDIGDDRVGEQPDDEIVFLPSRLGSSNSGTTSISISNARALPSASHAGRKISG